ncbi:helix-turn-helix domain-containing protein [Flavobacterium sp. D11R37]|uniref:helix-turn-helix domain-containing protein n=1 Tax=Flavobacterium coralii TaxID=2838017 RepID=UPI001CA75199|nr:helix-turn-helix transcriptional regulator [Flavobacterium coralii]MBY8963866.1 helix-turn-helix domain-containing protein [Flavobacterium coralii]
MQKELDQLEQQLNQRIYNLFKVKFDGNKSAFARASHCRESTIRRLFRNEQGITINLLLRIANALDVTAEELLKDIKYSDKDV